MIIIAIITIATPTVWKIIILDKIILPMPLGLPDNHTLWNLCPMRKQSHSKSSNVGGDTVKLSNYNNSISKPGSPEPPIQALRCKPTYTWSCWGCSKMYTIHSHKRKVRWWRPCISLEKRISILLTHNIHPFYLTRRHLIGILTREPIGCTELGAFGHAFAEQVTQTEWLCNGFGIMECKSNQVKTQGCKWVV